MEWKVSYLKKFYYDVIRLKNTLSNIPNQIERSDETT